MKAVWFFKFLVFLFSFLLLLGFTFVAYKIAEQKKDGKLKTPLALAQTDFSAQTTAAGVLKSGEEIVFALNCGENVCLTTKGVYGAYRLIVIAPEQGLVKNVLSLTEAP